MIDITYECEVEIKENYFKIGNYSFYFIRVIIIKIKTISSI